MSLTAVASTGLTKVAAVTNVVGATDWGFTGSDVWQQAMLVIASLATFILLGLAIKFAPRIIAVIFSAASGGKKG